MVQTESNAGGPQFVRMTTAPIGSLIVSLAIPTMISMLISSIYSMADTFFVSKLGTSASGAVGIVFSLMAIIQALGFMIGMGAGGLVSRLLGEQQNDRANEVASSALTLATLTGLLITILGISFLDRLMEVLGATPTILPYAREYASYILYAAPIMAASFLLNNILRSEGKAKYAMIGIASGGILNCVLDPIFIFWLHLGIAGAAIATAISQCVSLTILLSIFFCGKTVVKLRITSISTSFSLYASILQIGLPSFARQGLASLATVALNLAAAVYGDAAVAAMSIVGRIFMFVFSIILGIGQGYQPVLGYNYGAAKFSRVREACYFMLQRSSAIMVVCAIVGFIFSAEIIRFFIADDQAVIDIGSLALRFQALAMPCLPLMVCCNMTFQIIGRSWTATFLSTLRQGLFFLPLILLLPKFFGLPGVQITQALSDILTFAVCIPFLRGFLKQMKAAPVSADSTGVATSDAYRSVL